jgi:tetratricopeptide (TPR) repeat protein
MILRIVLALALSLASWAAIAQVRMPWMKGPRALPECYTAEHSQLFREGRYAELLAAHTRLLEEIGPAPTEPAATERAICLQTFIGISLSRLERHAEAIAQFEQTLPAAHRKLGADFPQTLVTEMNAAQAYGRAGRRSVEIRMQEELRPRVAKVHGPRSQEMHTLVGALGTAYAWAGNFAAVLPLSEELLAIAEELNAPGRCKLPPAECRAAVARAKQHLGDTLRRVGRAEEALPLAEAGYQGQAELRGRMHPNVIDARLVLASVHHELGARDKALEMEREALADAEQHLGANHPVTRKARSNLQFSLRRKE